MIHAMIDLTIKDFKNILLWYEIYSKNNRSTPADMDTYIKLQAMAISQKDEDDRFSRIRKGEDD